MLKDEFYEAKDRVLTLLLPAVMKLEDINLVKRPFNAYIDIFDMLSRKLNDQEFEEFDIDRESLKRLLKGKSKLMIKMSKLLDDYVNALDKVESVL